MEQITVTQAQLRDALLRWGQGDREGRCRSREETLAMSAEQVADESAEWLWKLLTTNEGDMT